MTEPWRAELDGSMPTSHEAGFELDRARSQQAGAIFMLDPHKVLGDVALELRTQRLRRKAFLQEVYLDHHREEEGQPANVDSSSNENLALSMTMTGYEDTESDEKANALKLS
eukprot:SAG31_NODE_24541_length_479_cov_0.905263_1_plen_112_part_00